MTAIERAQLAARREEDLRNDLAAYLRNVRVGRVERDDSYEDHLRREISEAERAWRSALDERSAERDREATG